MTLEEWEAQQGTQQYSSFWTTYTTPLYARTAPPHADGGASHIDRGPSLALWQHCLYHARVDVCGGLDQWRGCAGAQNTGAAGAPLSDEELARQLQRQLDMEDAALAAAQHDREPPRWTSLPPDFTSHGQYTLLTRAVSNEAVAWPC